MKIAKRAIEDDATQTSNLPPLPQIHEMFLISFFEANQNLLGWKDIGQW